MSNERRLFLFVVLSVAFMLGAPPIMQRLGLMPKPKPAAVKPVVAANEPEAKPAKDAGKPAPEPVKAKPAEAPAEAVSAPAVKRVAESTLVLGSSEHDSAKNPYHMAVKVRQLGAGIERIESSRYDAERKWGENRRVFRPLVLVNALLDEPSSFSLPYVSVRANDKAKPSVESEDFDLEGMLWEVVADAKGNLRRPLMENGKEVGQEIVLRTPLGRTGVEVLRTYRLRKAVDGVEMDLAFRETGDGDHVVVYKLLGPHGVPIEGEWYTATFRDAFVGSVDRGVVTVAQHSAYDVVKHQDDTTLHYSTLPIRFAGIENQYFAVGIEPVPPPTTAAESTIEEAHPIVIRETKDWQKSDISWEFLAKPIELDRNRPAERKYRIFAGPKTVTALAPYGADEVARYRKGGLPLIGDLGASLLSKFVIAPTLSGIHSMTVSVGRALGLRGGSYALSIILLTMLVRLCLFPLSRKQARMAKKMQELQPELTALKEKLKDDKEAFAREQFALFRKYNVNPMGGCLPAMIQLPILMGLWQTLNNSVALRHSRFLWIDNLAAPDMLFKWPFDMTALPLIGSSIGPYFNLLPVVVVALMMVQTKLFTPPPTTPEAEMQQKMMKYMMLVMMLMFYKVPAGLSIYIITSSLWQISERLLLPKVSGKVEIPLAAVDPVPTTKGGGAGNGSNGPSEPKKGGWFDEVRRQAQERLEKIMDDAQKNNTHRTNRPEDRRGDRDKDRDRDRDRDRNRPRPKPNRGR